MGREDAVGPAGVVEHGEGGPEAERAVRVGAIGRARPVRVGVHHRRQLLLQRMRRPNKSYGQPTPHGALDVFDKA